MANIYRVSVRALAEFACARGSIAPYSGMAERMREGREGHLALQRMLEPGWQAEAAVSLDVEIDNIILRVHGRADALLLEENCVHICEIKTTRRDPRELEGGEYPEHWAQALIYAHLFCCLHECASAQVTLLYAGVEGGEKRFEQRLTRRELAKRFLSYAQPYAEWLVCSELWKAETEPTLRALKFPFADYREGQREMARYVYSAMAQSGRTIIEAPTGIGKTAASLFGALKALGEGKITSIFYLTARTTGRRAAENALGLMRKGGLKLRSVTITAKEKACFQKKADCGACPYADGYYDRRRDVLRLAMQREVFGLEEIAALAREHEICPFELSLDLSEIADVVICDYNYVFDPRVRLKRHFERKNRAGLLIDEAHNLADRAREMYSAELSGMAVEKMRAQNALIFGTEDPLYEAATELLNCLTRQDAEYECTSEVSYELTLAAARFAELAQKLRVSDEATLEMMLEAAWFARVAAQFDESCYRTMIRPEGGRIAVRLWCFAPEKYLDRMFSRVGGTALFSATLAPIDFYANILAVPDRNARLVLNSPFPPENLFTARLPVSVKFRDRQETMEQVARIIRAMSDAHPGNYIACFPSHAYLEQAFSYYRMRYPDAHVIRQEARMSEAGRMEFIAQFRENPKQSMVAFIVLGGVFAEGVDLPGSKLSGAAIISTGIPQPNMESEVLREVYEDGFEGGYDAAYTYPGFRRVLQAAGRVIRTENDVGVVLLLDARYAAEKYQELMPSHWRMRKISSMSALNEGLRTFWAKNATSDRIPGD